jgi:hypothetical protein
MYIYTYIYSCNTNIDRDPGEGAHHVVDEIWLMHIGVTAAWLLGWQAGWQAGWLVGWLFNKLDLLLTGWLAGWLAGWRAVWQAGWLAGWKRPLRTIKM